MQSTVIQVGASRGFIIGTDDARYVVTAAHCLWEEDGLPPAQGASYAAERTYDCLGALGGPPGIVSAECVFIDPIADLAALGEPDMPEQPERSTAYLRLTEMATPFPLGSLRFDPSGQAVSAACVLSLGGAWFSCRVMSMGRSLWIEAAAQPICGGMSGSPIILPDGRAVGVVYQGGDRESGPNPLLTANLPAWLARAAVR
jgi:hypothetical protein